MKRITSTKNDTYKYVKKLLTQKSFRRNEGLFIAEGKRLIEDALKSECQPLYWMCSEHFHDHYPNYFSKVEEDVYLLTDALMQSISDTKSPQGILSVFQAPALTDEILAGKRFVFLCGIQDPGNLGTIIRTAEAFGIDGIYLSSDCVELYSPKVLRASMGGVFRIKFSLSDSPTETIAKMREKKISVYAAALREDAGMIGKLRMQEQVCIVIGNEGNGLSQEVIDASTNSVMIPMYGRAESLNVAIAAGILIWELVRPGDR